MVADGIPRAAHDAVHRLLGIPTVHLFLVVAKLLLQRLLFFFKLGNGPLTFRGGHVQRAVTSVQTCDGIVEQLQDRHAPEVAQGALEIDVVDDVPERRDVRGVGRHR